jgi:hypothetical protein
VQDDTSAAASLRVVGIYAGDIRMSHKKTNKKQTPWSLVRERTIPTERPPLVDEI